MFNQEKSKLILLTFLLVGVLIFAGCNNQTLSNLTVKVKNDSGNGITSEIRVSRKGNELSETGEIVQFKDLPTGEYDLYVKAEGYKNYEEVITLKEETEIKEVTLEKIKPEKEKAQETVSEPAKDKEESKPKLQPKLDLTINISDTNNNQLPATVTLKQNNNILANKQGNKVKFNDLKPGQYELQIMREGYSKVIKKVELDKENVNLSLNIPGGQVHHYLLDSKNNEVVINDLAKSDEVIIGISKLGLNSAQPNFNLDNKMDKLAKIEYDVRQKGTELVKKYGTDFAVTKSDYSLGDVKEFKVANDIKQDNVTATLQAVGEHILVFVDNNKKVDQKKIDSLVSEFDNKLYSNITGTKTQGKIIVLLTEFDSPYVTGYFDPADLYKNGNQEVMFYLNSDRKLNTLLTSTAHQYQHLVFYVRKAQANRTVNDAWINQGLAQLTQKLAGYIDYEKKGWSSKEGNGWIYDKKYGYLNNTEQVDLLLHDGSLAFSGASSLFANYIYEQYGPKLVESIMNSSKDPVTVIEEYTGKDFVQVYMNWMTTNVGDQILTINNKVYNYSSFDLQELPKFSTEKENITGIKYFKITDPKDTLKFNIPKDTKGKVAIVVIKK